MDESQKTKINLTPTTISTSSSGWSSSSNASFSSNLKPLIDTTAPKQTTTQPSYQNDFLSAFERARKLQITSLQTLKEFRAEDFLTRAEFAKMMVTFVATKNELETDKRDSSCLFYDYQEAGEFSLYVYDACNNGLMNGANGYFYPNNHIARAEAIATIVRYLEGKKLPENKDPRYTDYIAYAQANKFITPVSNLEIQQQKATRKDVLTILRKVSINS